MKLVLSNLQLYMHEKEYAMEYALSSFIASCIFHMHVIFVQDWRKEVQY